MTDKRQAIVNLMDRERGEIERAGLRESLAVGLSVRRAVLRAFRDGQDISVVLREAMADIVPLVVQAMLRAHLLGMRRSHLVAAPYLKAPRAFRRGDAHAKAIEALGAQLRFAKDHVARIGAAYGPIGAGAVAEATAAVNVAIQRSVLRSVAQGEHVRAGMKRLRGSLQTAGLGDAADPLLRPHRLEALYRTHVQLAYSAGRQHANQDPAIQEILWGYEYSAVGDARTRPSHQALDGTRLPKDHPRWSEIATPNGYNCRCVMLEVFSDDKRLATEKPPPDTTLDERGQVVRVGADEGFAFNPADTSGVMIPPPVVRRPPAPKAEPYRPAPARPVAPRVRVPVLPKPKAVKVPALPAPKPPVRPRKPARAVVESAKLRRLREQLASQQARRRAMESQASSLRRELKPLRAKAALVERQQAEIADLKRQIRSADARRRRAEREIKRVTKLRVKTLRETGEP